MREVIAMAIAKDILGSDRKGLSRQYEDTAQAALDAISEAGFVIVPKEPTEAMIEAGGPWGAKYASEAYKAMIEASQESE